MMVKWKPIRGYEGLYEISDAGDVWSVPRKNARGHSIGGKFLKCRTVKGTVKCGLFKDGKLRFYSVAATVLETFIGKRPKGSVVNFLDGDSANLSVKNLTWGTRSTPPSRAPLPQYGEKNKRAKLSLEDVLGIRYRRQVESARITDLAAKYSVAPGCIRQVVNRKTWKHV